MSQIVVPVGTTPAQAFPDELVDVERAVYAFLQPLVAVPDGGVAALSYFPNQATGQPPIDLTRGWPTFPGSVPALGVGAGAETDEQQREVTAGGFAGDVVAVDTNGAWVGSCAYYVEPLYSPVIVLLIHTNRDERDRLHNALRLQMTGMRMHLAQLSGRVIDVTVDAEKTDQEVGPPASEQPLSLYMSTFTVHVHHEVLQARHVTGPEGIIQGLEISTAVEA